MALVRTIELSFVKVAEILRDLSIESSGRSGSSSLSTENIGVRRDPLRSTLDIGTIDID